MKSLFLTSLLLVATPYAEKFMCHESKELYVPSPVPTDLFPAVEVDKLESFPGAQGCILIDFDGGVFQSSAWNGGKAITVPNSNISLADQHILWQKTAEGFRSFSINVTTSQAVFDSYPNNRKTVVVIRSDIQGGGIAKGDSFGDVEVIPAWVKPSSLTWMGKSIIHEAGHTLGLNHQGYYENQSFEHYYDGYGNYWGPIMGAGSAELNQWAKGEYSNANNQNDAISTITSLYNGISHRPDTVSNSFYGSAKLGVKNNVANDSGIIETSRDVDAYYFKTLGGNVSLSINSFAQFKMLNVKAWIENENGETIVQDSPVGSTDAKLSTILPAGEFVLKVSGGGEGAPLQNGFSEYGSIGSFTITGTIVGHQAAVPPVNILPVVNFNSPYLDGDTVLWRGGPLQVSVVASDNDGNVASVKILHNDTIISNSKSGSFLPNYYGNHNLSAIVTDNLGAQVEEKIRLQLVSNERVILPLSQLSIESVSSELNSEFVVASTADMVIDGKQDTKWNSGIGVEFPHWVVVDLGSETSLTSMEVEHYSTLNNARPDKALVLGSLDGKVWKPLGDTLLGDPSVSVDLYRFQKQKVRYVKYEPLSCFGKQRYISIGDFHFYTEESDYVSAGLQVSGLEALNSVGTYKIFSSSGDVIAEGLMDEPVSVNKLTQKHSLKRGMYLFKESTVNGEAKHLIVK